MKKLARNDWFLFATPLLVLGLAFLLRAVNMAVIAREEREWMKPRAIQDTNLIERPQADGSVKIFSREKKGSELLVIQNPPNPRRRKGLFQPQYFFLFGIAALFLSCVGSMIWIGWSFFQRRRQAL